MNINGYQQVSKSTDTYKTKNNATTNKETKESNQSAAIYEPGKSSTTDTSKLYTRDSVTIDKIKEELQYKQNQLQGLVEKLFLKQGQKINSIEDVIKALQSGKVVVDAETAAQAQAELGEDGYWGVEKTSGSTGVSGLIV